MALNLFGLWPVKTKGRLFTPIQNVTKKSYHSFMLHLSWLVLPINGYLCHYDIMILDIYWAMMSFSTPSYSESLQSGRYFLSWFVPYKEILLPFLFSRYQVTILTELRHPPPHHCPNHSKLVSFVWTRFVLVCAFFPAVIIYLFLNLIIKHYIIGHDVIYHPINVWIDPKW